MSHSKATLKQLKSKAYKTACVTNTKQLKKCYAEIAKLDMRRKHNWIKVVKMLQNMVKTCAIFDDAYSARQSAQIKQELTQTGEMLDWSKGKTDLVIAEVFASDHMNDDELSSLIGDLFPVESE